MNLLPKGRSKVFSSPKLEQFKEAGKVSSQKAVDTVEKLMTWLEKNLFGKVVFHPYMKNLMKISLLVLFITVLSFAKASRTFKLATYYTIGSILWYIVFTSNKGFNVFLNQDSTALTQAGSKKSLWFFDIAAMWLSLQGT